MSLRQPLPILALLLLMPLLGGCFAAVVGGAAVAGSAAHDRRDVGTWTSDKRIFLGAYNDLNKDKELALRNDVVITVYDGVMLLAGTVRNEELKQRAQKIVSGFDGTRRIINELQIGTPQGFWSRRRDNTITAHAKTALLDLTSLPGFDPTRVNVTTVNRITYLMGRVSHEEDEAVTSIVREVNGVEKVVKLFEYTD
ncbi:MAG: BON domain-containing protein [Dokdonella sp.]|uniref:BON domain-containing protein n=1 Tax=Dokdonella sp. TaxID=2291710 RepID=UPI0025C6BF73|nr:BON domain-containing protein [Dokdonella sp.]MBZ0221865.1 BON domain-containing protein [Dokdonella sp.]